MFRVKLAKGWKQHVPATKTLQVTDCIDSLSKTSVARHSPPYRVVKDPCVRTSRGGQGVAKSWTRQKRTVEDHRGSC